MSGDRNFLDRYRLVAPTSRTPSCELYCAEHTYKNSGPVLLIVYPGITLTTAGDQNLFLQKVRGNTLRWRKQTIAVRDAGIADQHPYLVTAYTEEIMVTGLDEI